MMESLVELAPVDPSEQFILDFVSTGATSACKGKSKLPPQGSWPPLDVLRLVMG